MVHFLCRGVQGVKLGADRDDVGDRHSPAEHSELERALGYFDVRFLSEHITVGRGCLSEQLGVRTVGELWSVQPIQLTCDPAPRENHKRLHSLNEFMFPRGEGRRDCRHHACTVGGRPHRPQVVRRFHAPGNVKIPTDDTMGNEAQNRDQPETGGMLKSSGRTDSGLELDSNRGVRNLVLLLEFCVELCHKRLDRA